MQKQLLTRKEISKKHNINYQKINALIRRKKIQIHRLGGIVYVCEGEIINSHCAPEGTRTPIDGTGNRNSIH